MQLTRSVRCVRLSERLNKAWLLLLLMARSLNSDSISAPKARSCSKNSWDEEAERSTEISSDPVLEAKRAKSTRLRSASVVNSGSWRLQTSRICQAYPGLIKVLFLLRSKAVLSKKPWTTRKTRTHQQTQIDLMPPVKCTGNTQL